MAGVRACASGGDAGVAAAPLAACGVGSLAGACTATASTLPAPRPPPPDTPPVPSPPSSPARVSVTVYTPPPRAPSQYMACSPTSHGASPSPALHASLYPRARCGGSPTPPHAAPASVAPAPDDGVVLRLNAGAAGSKASALRLCRAASSVDSDHSHRTPSCFMACRAMAVARVRDSDRADDMDTASVPHARPRHWSHPSAHACSLARKSDPKGWWVMRCRRWSTMPTARRSVAEVHGLGAAKTGENCAHHSSWHTMLTVGGTKPGSGRLRVVVVVVVVARLCGAWGGAPALRCCAVCWHSSRRTFNSLARTGTPRATVHSPTKVVRHSTSGPHTPHTRIFPAGAAAQPPSLPQAPASQSSHRLNLRHAR